jgi:uncharacterized SAM-binding protein YcdF (DUF218 family)
MDEARLGMRLVVVLGYSAWRGAALHPVCAARLAVAAELASEDDTVLLSGRPEASLMRGAWTGPEARVLCDGEARVTAESAAHVARLARELEASEVVIVTSWWHCRRAAVFFRRALRGSGIAVRTIGAPSWSGRLLLREAGAWAVLPLQMRRARV